MAILERQTWRIEAVNIIKSNKAFSNAVMQSPQVRYSLGNYLTQLQRAVDRGQFTPKQALNIFKTDTKNISQRLQQQSQRATTSLPPDPNDLTKPLNMQNALNNPNTYAYRVMEETLTAITATLNATTAAANAAIDQAITEEQASEEQSAENIEQENITEANNEEISEQTQTPSDSDGEQSHLGKDLKEAAELVTVGILDMDGLGLKEAENITENVFKKAGEVLGMDTANLGTREEAVKEVEEKVSSPFDMKLKPPKE